MTIQINGFIFLLQYLISVMKKVLFTLLVVAMVSCNNSTETTVSDTMKCDSTQCDSVCADSTKVLVDTASVK